ncbi:hypothetical protein CPB86DRAFT_339951 [Serendipita vermifera]|nr:hypothetical protein CPB86DRAFT_339951 [Serendipita vermifera]
MISSLKSTLILLFSLAAVQGANFDVNVGQGGFTYSPDHVSGAASGDTVTFHFSPGGHTVTQGSLDTPCSPLSGGFNSGPHTGSTDGTDTYQVTVNDTQPIWIYCAVPGHCRSGMVSRFP